MKMKRCKRLVLIALMLLSVLCYENNTSVVSVSAASKVKNACAAALKATGNADKLGYKSSTPTDFDAISYKHNKKVSSMYFVTSDNTAYIICVAKAKSTNNASELLKAFQTYKYNQIHGTYFKTDYTKAEQNVLKNAIYGKKGKYVWYISMSSKKKNLAGEKALKKKI
jgi:hypothetical protein